jgi:hypothetical protein
VGVKDDVLSFADRISRLGWEQVRDALYAIGNDTDAIISDDDPFLEEWLTKAVLRRKS